MATSIVQGELDLSKIEQVISSVSLNVASGTAQALYTPPSGKKLIPTRFVLRDPSAAMILGAFSIGFVGATYLDVVASATYAGLTGAGLFLIINPIASVAYGTANAVLYAKVNVTQAATTLTIDTFGYIL